jgi:hypothetical protein
MNYVQMQLPISSAGRLRQALITETKMTYRESFLLAASGKRASLSSQLTSPLHAFQAWYSTKNCPILQSLTPLQPALHPPMEV